MIFPSFITRMISASLIVESLCATIKLVLPFIIFRNAFCIFISVLVSIDEVASSSMSIGGRHTDGWWYYVKNGLIDWKYTGLAQNTSGEWYYVKNGAYTQEYTGLVYNAGNWFYVENGVLKWDYSGYVHHTDGKW